MSLTEAKEIVVGNAGMPEEWELVEGSFSQLAGLGGLGLVLGKSSGR